METLRPEDLKENSMFQNLDSREMGKIMELSERKTYSTGSFVFSGGEEARQLFLVEKGLVGIIVQLRPTTQLTVSTESRGGILGWSALVPPHSYTASAKCFEQCELLAFEGAKLREFCYREPDVGVKIMEGLAHLIAVRLSSTNLKMLEAMWK